MVNVWAVCLTLWCVLTHSGREVFAASQKGFKKCNNTPLCHSASQVPLASLLNLRTHAPVSRWMISCNMYLSSQDPEVIKFLVFNSWVNLKDILHLQLHWWLLFQHAAECTHFTIVHGERQWILCLCHEVQSLTTSPTHTHTAPSKSLARPLAMWSRVFVKFENVR